MLLVFGSINVDFVYKVDVFPGPGETRLASDFQVLPGGKGANQAVAAGRAGGRVLMAGSIGDDPLGQIGLDALKSADVDVSAVRRQSMPSGTAAIHVDASGENAIVVAAGANALSRADDVADKSLAAVTTLLLQMEVPHKENWRLLKRARAHGIRTILNLAPFAPIPDDALADIDFLICNEVEFAGLTASSDISSTSPDESIKQFSITSQTSVIVTLGDKGVVASDQTETFIIPSLNVMAKDTTGAGDAFCGAFAAVVDGKGSFELALRMGVVAGALACQNLGAQASAPDRQSIEDALSSLGVTRREG